VKNSLARHAELVSASPLRPYTSYNPEHISEPFWEMLKQVQHDGENVHQTIAFPFY
jgi:hypothetical protein